MKLFFGKIKPTADNRQIVGAFYETLSPVKLGEIKPDDYAFIVSGGDMHLWKARERVDTDGHVKMEFDVIEQNLPLPTKKFIAFKYFKLDSSLIVLTVRQSPKAFYPIEIADTSLTEAMITTRATYENEDNFRKIIVLPDEREIDKRSTNIQLYFKQGQLHVAQASFIDILVADSFIDNLSKLGRGRQQKDSALAKVKEGEKTKKIFTYDELSILRLYDALFNTYDSKEVAALADKGIVDDSLKLRDSEASLELKSVNQIFYGPPGTGKTYRVIKSFCVDEETVFSAADKRIKLDREANFWHLAPGRHGYLWNQLKGGDVLGYEWVSKDWGDLNELTPKDVEDEGEGGNYQLISYLREVQKGDYICVISGIKLLGIAEVTQGYDYSTAKKNEFKFQTVPVRWLKQFELPLLLDSTQTKTFVRLNDGRRWENLLELLRRNGFYFDEDEVIENKITSPKNYTFVSFHQSFSYEDFVEGIKPVLPESDEEQDAAKIQYEIVPGIFYRTCEKAAQLAGYKTLKECLSDTRKNRKKQFRQEHVLEYYLIIDELNRGNVSSIFGELITLIEDDKRLGAENEIDLTLPYSKLKFGVPLNLRLVATMNTADRSIEALDTALRRRFTFEELLPDPSLLPNEHIAVSVNLQKLLIAINIRIEKLLDKDHTIGHAFLLNIDNIQKLKQVFSGKIIPLLQEYFYGDYGKVGLVIGAPFVTFSDKTASFMKIDGYDAGDLEERVTYSLASVDEMTDDKFLAAVKAIYGE